jgi:hypothetical protein
MHSQYALLSVTEFGWRVAFFFTRIYVRIPPPGLAHIIPKALDSDNFLERRFNQTQMAIND